MVTLISKFTSSAWTCIVRATIICTTLVAMHANIASAQPAATAPTPPSANPPGGPADDKRRGASLYNFIDVDPTEELVAACALSPEQTAHFRQCYETYRISALALADKLKDRIDKEGLVEEVRRLGQDAPPELRLKSRESVQRAKESIKAQNLAIEAAYVDGMLAVIPEAQQPQFRGIVLAVQRRTWIDRGGGVPQDFFQFADPIAILLVERPALADKPEQLALFDEFIAASETDLAARLPQLWCAHEDARVENRIAEVDPNANKTVALRRNVNAWNALYSALNQIEQNGAAIFDAAGVMQPARRARETFWGVCFPDLMGNEITPTLFEVLDARLGQFPPETQEAVRALRSQYLERRHALIRDAVNGHVRDYMKIADADQRRRDLYLNNLGASSLELTKLQIARHDLGVRTQQSLIALIGPLDELMAAPEIKKREAIDMIVYETPHIRKSLEEVQQQYEAIAVGQPAANP